MGNNIFQNIKNSWLGTEETELVVVGKIPKLSKIVKIEVA